MMSYCNLIFSISMCYCEKISRKIIYNNFLFFKQTKLNEQSAVTNNDNFGNMESSVIAGIVRPISLKGDLESICGKYRGIQGHHNSCYLDATLFSMFTFTSVFDNLLFR